ncbi:hypothetical protein ACE7GA_23775 [Roseomonas sp. CCTCC AB2023176]|uniref:hypothetical protein n=1 Tax=Roseomonas sp. CCTCC AB2023176 TaxID=3342640 RepID=UPI0035E31C3F
MTVRRPLLVALPAALAGFGLWIWITGPGTSVPNALIAFGVAVVFGRVTWTLVAPRTEDDAEPGAPPASHDGGTSR